MNIIQYQEDVLRTAPKNKTFREMLDMCALGVSGEAGEVADEIKKLLYHGHPLNKEKILKELGDVLWYATCLANALDTNLLTVMHMNVEKRKARYPNGFEPEKSINRMEGDV